jgi:hypothetical protein
MPQIGSPSFSALGPAACREILERNHIGRIAFSFHDDLYALARAGRIRAIPIRVQAPSWAT